MSKFSKFTRLNLLYKNMKNILKSFFFCCWIFLITSCSSSVYYLGDSFPKTNTVDIYYAEKDVSKKYKTIGQLTNGKFINYSVETIKNDMIKAAKENGADGIIIYDRCCKTSVCL